MIALDDIADIRLNSGSALDDEIANVYFRIGDAWVKVWSYLSALAVSIPSFAYGGGSSSSAITVSTDAVPVTVTGGQAPYSYSWARVGSGSPAWTITGGTTAEARFSTTVSAGTIETATFRCTVTDALGTIVASNDCVATVENFGGYL